MAMSELILSPPQMHELPQARRENFRGRLEEKIPSRLTRRLAAAAMTALPLFGAAVAINHGPAKEINVAGATVEISTQLGQNYTSLGLSDSSDNELLRQDHTSILGKAIGVSATIDQHQITPGFLQQVANDPEPLAGRVEEAAKHHFFERAGEGAGAVVAIECGAAALYLYGGRRLRRAAGASAIAFGLLTSYQGATAITQNDYRTVLGSSLFDKTPLKGTEINVTPQILNYLMLQVPRGEDAEFYPAAAEQINALIVASPELNEPGWNTIVLVDDLQSNTGIAQVVATAAKTLDAPLITTGDLTNLATRPEEEYIIDALNHYAEPTNDRPIYLIAGLHDTQSVIDYAKEQGIIMPDGQTITINGVTFMGFNDPRISNISQLEDGTILRDPSVSIEQFIDHMKEASCSERPNFVVTHDHKLAVQLTQTGCTPLVIGARTFDDTSEVAYSRLAADHMQSATLTLGSGGGHATTNIFSKDLERSAQFVILQTNALSGAVRSFTVTVSKEGVEPLSTPFELVPPTTAIEAQPASKDEEVPKADGKRILVR